MFFVSFFSLQWKTSGRPYYLIFLFSTGSIVPDWTSPSVLVGSRLCRRHYGTASEGATGAGVVLSCKKTCFFQIRQGREIRLGLFMLRKELNPSVWGINFISEDPRSAAKRMVMRERYPPATRKRCSFQAPILLIQVTGILSEWSSEAEIAPDKNQQPGKLAPTTCFINVASRAVTTLERVHASDWRRAPVALTMLTLVSFVI